MNAEARMNPALERPQRSHPQHLQALERANAVRLARAELKRRVAEGEITAAEVILSSPWEAASMTVSDLLTSQHRWGHTRCRKFLQCIPMSETKTIGSMTERQRRAVAQLLIAGDAAAQVPRATEPAEALHPVLAAV
jgi:hypothetical protein